MSEGMSKVINEQKSKRSGGRERSEQSGANGRATSPVFNESIS